MEHETIVPIVIGALGTVTKGLLKGLEDLEVSGRVVLMALSCSTIRKNSVSLLRFPFLSQVQVFWYEMLFITRLKRP